MKTSEKLIYDAVSIVLHLDVDELDCVHFFNILSDMFM